MSAKDAGAAEGLLGPLEYEVMRCLWVEAPASVPQVLERLNDRRQKQDCLAYTTVMTVLARLHTKDLVSRVRQGRGFDYTPRFTEAGLVDHFSRREVQEMVRRYGPVAIAHFADVLEQADPRLLAQLRDAAGRADDA